MNPPRDASPVPGARQALVTRLRSAGACLHDRSLSSRERRRGTGGGAGISHLGGDLTGCWFADRSVAGTGPRALLLLPSSMRVAAASNGGPPLAPLSRDGAGSSSPTTEGTTSIDPRPAWGPPHGLRAPTDQPHPDTDLNRGTAGRWLARSPRHRRGGRHPDRLPGPASFSPCGAASSSARSREDPTGQHVSSLPGRAPRDGGGGLGRTGPAPGGPPGPRRGPPGLHACHGPPAWSRRSGSPGPGRRGRPEFPGHPGCAVARSMADPRAGGVQLPAGPVPWRGPEPGPRVGSAVRVGAPGSVWAPTVSGKTHFVTDRWRDHMPGPGPPGPARSRAWAGGGRGLRCHLALTSTSAAASTSTE